MLQFGADSRVRASNGWTAADFCKQTGQVECQELLEEVHAVELSAAKSLPAMEALETELQGDIDNVRSLELSDQAAHEQEVKVREARVVSSKATWAEGIGGVPGKLSARRS